MPQLGSCASSGHAWQLWAARNSWKEAGSLGAQSLPWVHELIACRAADFSAFDHLGAEVFMREQSWRNVRRRAQLVAHGNATADAKWAREVVTCGWPRGIMVKRVVLAAEPDVALEPLGGAGQDADSIAFDYAGVSSAPTFASGRRRPRRSPASSARCLATTSRAPSTSTTARASCRIVTGRISSSRSRPW